MSLVLGWVTLLTGFAGWYYHVPGSAWLLTAFAAHEISTHGLTRLPEYRVRWHTLQLLAAVACAGLSASCVNATGGPRLGLLTALAWYFWVLQWVYVGKALVYSAFLGFLQIPASHQVLVLMERITATIDQHFATRPAPLVTLSAEALEARAPLRFGRDCRHEADACTICCEEINASELHRHLPGCDHIFHAVCVDIWLLQRSSTCPLCRTAVAEE